MKNIILVEDNKIERRNISRIVENISECNLIGVFSNGLDAMKFLNDNKVDIVITDVQMAFMDGIELIKNIRNKGLECEFIIISGYQDFDNAKSAVGLDVVDYVMKPIINNELETAINKAILKFEKKCKRETDYAEMQKQVEFSKMILREQFVRELLVDSNLSAEKIRYNEQLLGMKISTSQNSFLIVKIKEDDVKKSFKITHIVKDYVAEFQTESVEFHPFIINETEIGVVCVSEDVDIIIPSCIELKNKITNDLDVEIFVAMSSISGSVGDMGRKYNECKKTLKDFHGKWNFVALYETVCEENNWISGMQEKIRQMVFTNDIKDMSEYLKYCVNKKRDVDKNFAFIFVNFLEWILSQFEMSFDNLEILSSKELWKKLDDYNSIIDINNFLLNLAIGVEEEIKSLTSTNSKIVRNIKKIIEENYSEHLTVTSIANKVNFSRKHIHRIFTKETGMTIFEYLTNYRIEVAKKLLLENKVVDDIMFEVGYKDRKYFYEIFKERTGMTPSQFREMNRK